MYGTKYQFLSLIHSGHQGWEWPGHTKHQTHEGGEGGRQRGGGGRSSSRSSQGGGGGPAGIPAELRERPEPAAGPVTPSTDQRAASQEPAHR